MSNWRIVGNLIVRLGDKFKGLIRTQEKRAESSLNAKAKEAFEVGGSTKKLDSFSHANEVESTDENSDKYVELEREGARQTELNSDDNLESEFDPNLPPELPEREGYHDAYPKDYRPAELPDYPNFEDDRERGFSL